MHDAYYGHGSRRAAAQSARRAVGGAGRSDRGCDRGGGGRERDCRGRARERRAVPRHLDRGAAPHTRPLAFRRRPGRSTASPRAGSSRAGRHRAARPSPCSPPPRASGSRPACSTSAATSCARSPATGCQAHSSLRSARCSLGSPSIRRRATARAASATSARARTIAAPCPSASARWARSCPTQWYSRRSVAVKSLARARRRPRTASYVFSGSFLLERMTYVSDTRALVAEVQRRKVPPAAVLALLRTGGDPDRFGQRGLERL